MKPFSRALYTALTLCFSLLALSAQAAGDIEVHKAWVREAPPNARVLAAYMTLRNHSDMMRTLNRVTSPDFEEVEIHRTEYHEGMAHMKAISHVQIDKHGSVEFKPGGLHLMLIKPRKHVMAGDQVALTLHFADKHSMEVMAPVEKAMGGMDHSHHEDMHKHDMHERDHMEDRDEHREDHHDDHHKH